MPRPVTSRPRYSRYTAPPGKLAGLLIALAIFLIPIVVPLAFKAAENPRIEMAVEHLLQDV